MMLMFIALGTIVSSKAGEFTVFLLPNLPLRPVNVTCITLLQKTSFHQITTLLRSQNNICSYHCPRPFSHYSSPFRNNSLWSCPVFHYCSVKSYG